MLQSRRGRRSKKVTPQWHDPGKPVQNPFWKPRAQLNITGFAQKHRLEKGVSCQAALFLGVTLCDVWQAARCESMGYGAGKTNTTCPLGPACLPSLTRVRAEGQRTWSTAGTDNDKALTTGTCSFSGCCFPSPWTRCPHSSSVPTDTPSLRIQPTAPGACAKRLQPEIPCTGMIFPRVVYSSHSFQQQEEKKSLIQDTKKIGIKRLPSILC